MNDIGLKKKFKRFKILLDFVCSFTIVTGIIRSKNKHKMILLYHVQPKKVTSLLLKFQQKP